MELLCQLNVKVFSEVQDANSREWRATSFNGIIRRWYRLLWHGIEKNENSPKGEDMLFGLSGKNKGALYFALSNLSSKNVTLTIYFHPYHPQLEDSNNRDKYLQRFVKALTAAFYLGNFGAKAKKGYGSLYIEDVKYGDLLKKIGISIPTYNHDKEFNFYQKENLKNFLRGTNFENITIFKYHIQVDNFNSILENLHALYKDIKKEIESEVYIKLAPQNKEKIWFNVIVLSTDTKNLFKEKIDTKICEIFSKYPRHDKNRNYTY